MTKDLVEKIYTDEILSCKGCEKEIDTDEEFIHVFENLMCYECSLTLKNEIGNLLSTMEPTDRKREPLRLGSNRNLIVDKDTTAETASYCLKTVMLEELDKTVIGNFKAKDLIVNSFLTHFYSDVKCNVILLRGASGSGKTMMVKELARITKFDLCVEDVTALTPSGYKGRNLENVIKEINPDKKTIMFFDEVDKLASGELDFQTGFLKLFDSVGSFERGTYNLDNIFFVLGGVFKDRSKNQLGFGDKATEKGEMAGVIKKYLREEVYNRISDFVEVDSLKPEDINKLVLNEASVAGKAIAFLKKRGKEVIIEDSYFKILQEMLEISGVRGIENKVVQDLKPHFFMKEDIKEIYLK